MLLWFNKFKLIDSPSKDTLHVHQHWPKKKEACHHHLLRPAPFTHLPRNLQSQPCSAGICHLAGLSDLFCPLLVRRKETITAYWA